MLEHELTLRVKYYIALGEYIYGILFSNLYMPQNNQVRVTYASGLYGVNVSVMESCSPDQCLFVNDCLQLQKVNTLLISCASRLNYGLDILIISSLYHPIL